MTVAFTASWEGCRRAFAAVVPHVDRRDSSKVLSKVRLDVVEGAEEALVWATNLATSGVARIPLMGPAPETTLLELETEIVKKILVMFPEVNDSITEPERVLTVTQPRDRLLQIEDTSGLFAGQEITVPLSLPSARFPDVPFLQAAHVARSVSLASSQWLDHPELGRFSAATRAYGESLVLTERHGSTDALVTVGTYFTGTMARFEPKNGEALVEARADAWAERLPDPSSRPRGCDVNDGRIGDQIDNLLSAVRIVVADTICSTSALQRRLKLGFAGTVRLIDLLAKFDVIDQDEGALLRVVSIELLADPARVDAKCDEIIDAHRAEQAQPRGDAA